MFRNAISRNESILVKSSKRLEDRVLNQDESRSGLFACLRQPHRHRDGEALRRPGERILADDTRKNRT